MNHEELLLEEYNFQLDPIFKFKKELNIRYNNLCFSIKKRKKDISLAIDALIYLICEKWEYVDKLSYEELYMVLNVIKLARSQNNDIAITLADTDLFQKLEESYPKSI